MDIHNCTMCPRRCGADRTSSRLGFCGIDGKPHIAEICVHKGEEPVLGGSNGVVNVFFSSCNLRCVYCQNYTISQQKPSKPEITSYEKAVTTIAGFLCQGINTLGFVSPSHQVFQMRTIIDMLRKRGFNPTIIYNSNAYDDPETLRELESYVDIYLPDYKYSNNDICVRYSSAPNYPEAAQKAIAEMYYQKGSRLELNDDGIAESGLIIRHLVLPNNVENSIKALETIAYDISPRVHLSLMAQYFPEYKALEISELNRAITAEEYQTVCDKAEELGLVRGWQQQLSSNENYRPDFQKDGNPFENN
ncbi:MAG: 4Fe-4S cluster-binding domain-containing protein [Bacteroidales bacterium]|nr:4Fe-4S cluster-binding domain-containing protein [Bacteroidales bacterium]